MRSRAATEFMARKGVTLSPEASLAEAIRVLLHHRGCCVPVVDDQRKLLGVLSEENCLRVMMAEALDGLPEGEVRNFMTTDVEVIAPDTTLYDIVALFLKRHYCVLPVVEDGALVGMVSRGDALHAIEMMRDDSRLYGQESAALPADEQSGVDSAMRRARGR